MQSYLCLCARGFLHSSTLALPVMRLEFYVNDIARFV